MSNFRISRRQFLRATTLSSGGLLLAACGATAIAPTDTPAPTPLPTASAADEVEVLAKDVIDFSLTGDDWSGQYGWVKFRLQEGRFAGEPIYFIRTDSSNQEFATENGLIHVPLLGLGRDIAAPMYEFDDGRPPVLGTAPDQPGYLSLWQLKRVSISDSSATLDSVDAVEKAAADDQILITDSDILVNYPVVKWPGGELANDDEKTDTLGKGQLIEPVNLDDMTVTLKLHQCFPGSRYILTDTSFAGMAPMMSVPAAEPTLELLNNGGTDEIWIFVNGIAGSGVMGFQPAIFDNQAGHPAWSPFWDHRALKWVDESEARVLRSSAEVRELISSGALEEFRGVPDTHPNGFVVNCPAPILAPNTFAG